MFNFQKVFFILILLTGIYISFLPNTWTQASFFDFLKSDTPAAPETIESFDLESFSKIPVLRGGRVKPLDSVARNILLVLRNKRTALRVLEKEELENINRLKESKDSLSEEELITLKAFRKIKKVMIPQEGVEKTAVEVKAIDWLAQVLFAPEKADKLKTFLIDHDQVLGLLNQKLPRMVNSILTMNFNPSCPTSTPLPEKQAKLRPSFGIVFNKISSSFIDPF